jgi:hypothetical protein
MAIPLQQFQAVACRAGENQHIAERHIHSGLQIADCRQARAVFAASAQQASSISSQ